MYIVSHAPFRFELPFAMLVVMRLTFERHGMPIIIALAAVFFLLYSALAVSNRDHRYTWPDEMANYHFIQSFVNTGSFRITEPLAIMSKNIVHPRSTNVYEGDIVPGTFIGFPLLYGTIALLLGSFIVLLTPALVSVSGVAFYYVVRQLFHEHIAFIAAILYFVNPAVWYYASFTLLPNMPFVALLVIASASIVRGYREHTPRTGWIFFGALCAALALSIRPYEGVWVLPVAAFSFYELRQRVRVHHILTICLALVLVMIPNMLYAKATFGSYLGSGYFGLESGTLPTEVGAPNAVLAALLPFGLHPVRALGVVWSYVIALQWWLFVFIGWRLFHAIRFRHTHTRVYRNYLIVTLCVVAYLILYYGSWQFEDRVTLVLSSLGISYIRYWLPIFVLLVPLAAEGIAHIATLARNYERQVLVLLVAALIGMSGSIVWFERADSLWEIRSQYEQYANTAAAVFAVTAQDGVIITERGDKIFWPDRAVISKWGSEDVYKLQALALENVPLYFFGLERPEDIAYINDRRLLAYDMRIVADQPLAITPNGTLYHVVYASRTR